MYTTECEALLALIKESAYIKNLSGEYTFANKAFCTLLSTTRETLSTRRENDFFHSSNPSTDESILEEIRKADSITRIVRLKSDDSLFEITEAPIYQGGELAGIRGVGSKLPAKTVDEPDGDAAMQILKAVNSGNIGVWNWNLRTNKVSFSKEWIKQIGYEEHEFSDTVEEWKNRIHPDDFESTVPRVRKIIKERKQNEEFCFRFRHKDGSYRWINAYASVYCDDLGKTDCVLGCYIDITEKKRVEDELKRSENIYGTLIDTLPYGIILSDLEGRVIYCNHQQSSMHHCEDGELIGNYVWDLIENQEAKEWYRKAFFDRIRNQTKPKNFITQSRTKDGKLIDVQINWNYIYNSEGTLDGIISVVSDISDQVRTANERKQNQERFQKLIESLPDIIMRFDRQHRHLFVSENVNSIMPLEAGDLIGKTHEELGFPEEMCELWESALEEVFVSKTPSETEFEFESTKGIIVYNWRLVPEFDEKGEVKAVLTLARDITNSKMLQRNLKKSEERFATAMNATNDGLWDLNVETEEVYFSPGWKRMLGYKAGELKNSLSIFNALLHPHDLPAVHSLLEEHIKGKTERFEAEYRMRHRNGNWIHVLSRANGIQNEHGKVNRVVGTHIDMTERKRFENELIEAKQRAEDANNAKDEFLAIMSHELRTPLNPIMGFASLMQYGISDEPYDTYIQTILKSSQRMVKLIDELLSYSRMQREFIKPGKKPFKLDDLVKETIENVQAVKGTNHINTQNGRVNRITGYDHNLTIISDQDVVHRILNNLLTNACKYTSDGTITLYAGTTKSNGDKETLRFEIEDDGIGIPQKKLDQIFDPFVQVDSSFSRPYEGVGLGLAICKKLVTFLNGRIGVQSEEGEGSLFWVEIPVDLELPKPNVISPYEKRSSQSLQRFESSWNILVAEDQIDNQVFIESCILALNGTPKIVNNGEEVLKELTQNHYDLVLMDLSMPVMDGIEATKRIRKTSGIQNTPIIALTAHNTSIAKKEAEEAGVNAYVPKPITIEGLSKAIRDQLELLSISA